VTYQAKRERERRPDEALGSCSFRSLEIFAPGRGCPEAFDRLNPVAVQPLPEAEKGRLRGLVKGNCGSFVERLFGRPGMGSRPSDISYEYVSHLYVLYPNVR